MTKASKDKKSGDKLVLGRSINAHKDCVSCIGCFGCIPMPILVVGDIMKGRPYERAHDTIKLPRDKTTRRMRGCIGELIATPSHAPTSTGTSSRLTSNYEVFNKDNDVMDD